MTTRTRTHTRRTRSWSKQVTEHSHAMELEPEVFRKSSAHAIAESVKRSAEHSQARRAAPFRSAMSMLSFYMNRAGGNLSGSERKKLETAKEELRKLFNRPTRASSRHSASRHH